MRKNRFVTFYLGLKFIYNRTEHITRRCCGYYWYRVLKVKECVVDDNDVDDVDDDGYDKGKYSGLFLRAFDQLCCCIRWKM